MGIQIQISFENVANHPDYDEAVAVCGDRHGKSIRQWHGEVWFCGQCGHRVVVKTQGVLEGTKRIATADQEVA